MAQDFANGQRHKRAPRSDARKRPRQRQSAFHWGSFGAGIALGIAFTLAGALLPEWWGNRPAAVAAAPIASDSAPVTRFEFFERLPNEKISARPEPADTSTAPPVANGPQEFLLQAGSFTNKEDAERLRATLAQSGWNTQTATVMLSSGATRHRVIVGPFASSQETQRAITQLRKQDVDALVLARKPTAG
jgi:cell division septation protein DedD